MPMIRAEFAGADEFAHIFALLWGVGIERQAKHGAKGANFLASLVKVADLPIVQTVFRFLRASDDGENWCITCRRALAYQNIGAFVGDFHG